MSPMQTPELPSTFESFRAHILQQVASLRDEHGPENLDLSYPAASHTLSPPDFRTRQFAYAAFLAANEARLYDSYSALEDPQSRELFLALILFRLLGHRKVRLPSNNSLHANAVAREQLLDAQPSSFDSLPGGEALRHFIIQTGNEMLALDCLAINVRFSFFLRQYFLDRAGITVGPRAGDHVIDAGACFGDTAVCFAKQVGPSGLVHSFEPLAVHLQVLHHNVSQNNCDNVKVHPCGLGNANRDGKADEGRIDPGHAAHSTTPLRTLDAMLEQGAVDSVDFIKIDVEGNELSLLQGARETISTYMPRMAISIYHLFEDYFTIPNYIARNFGEYRMFIDNYTISDSETILYCTPEKD